MKLKPDNQADLLALFESGTALDYAWVEFSQGLDRFALRALQTAPENNEILREENPERYKQISKGWLPKTWESRQKKLELRTRDERCYLLDAIYGGDLIALGFRTLPDGSDELVRVPRQHFFVDHERKDPFPDINWNKGELRARTESYFDIRIVKAPDSRIRRENDSVDKTGTRKGRPNTSEQIRSAVEHAWKTDSTFRDLPNRQVQAEEIRARLCGERAQRAHDMVGFSDSTIKRIIGEVFKKFGAD